MMSSRFCALFCLIGLIGCAAKIKEVPDFSETKFRGYKLRFVQNSDTRLQVNDLRVLATKANSVQVANKVTELLQRVLSKSGIAVRSESKNLFTLSIKDRDQDIANIHKERCVVLDARFSFSRKDSGKPYHMTGRSFGCYEFKHFIGFRMDGDVTPAYQAAIESLFERLEEKGRHLDHR